MTNYYFLNSTLPSLQIGVEPEIPFDEFCALLELNLRSADLEKTEVVRRYYDLENLRRIWQAECVDGDVDHFDSRGNLSEGDIREGFLTQEGFPEYVFAFMREHEGPEACLRYFPQLLRAYFQEEMECSCGFLKEFLEFERCWRLVMMGFRAKEIGRDLVQELQFEDPSDEIVAQLLAQKDARTYEPPYGFEDLKVLYDGSGKDPFELHKALCDYRFRKVEQMHEGDVFSIDPVLAYLVQLIIAEKWQELDQQQGIQMIDSIVKETL